MAKRNCTFTISNPRIKCNANSKKDTANPYGRTGSKMQETAYESRDGGEEQALPISCEYNAEGRLFRQRDPDSVVKTFGYNEAGARQSVMLFRNGKDEIRLWYT